MIRIFILAFLLLTSLWLPAQTTRMSYRLAVLAADESRQTQPVSILVKGNTTRLKELILHSGGTLKHQAGNILSATVPASALRILENSPALERMEEGRIQLKALNDRMLVNNRIDLVHQGMSPLLQGYNGEGVVMGIIDSGIDFSHPDFKDSTGQTRILWIWDHILPDSTNSPQPFGYGQEFSAADVNTGNAAAHVDQSAHGTHVAGIAAGNGSTNAIFTGAAPKADIIAVSVDFNAPDDNWLSTVADAVDYIFNKADSLNKPCVINISAGTYIGSHDGKDLQAQYIDNLITSKDGRMVVAAAGNAGNYPLHLEHSPAGDTLFTWFRQFSTTGIYIEFWGDTTDMNTMQFTLGADVQPSFEDRGQMLPLTISMNNGVLLTDSIMSFSGNRLAQVQSFGQVIDDRYSMSFYILPDSTSYYFRVMTEGNSKVDCWSFDMINSGLPSPLLYPNITKYRLPDFNQTICSSFQCSDKVITTGQYVNRNNYIDVNNNLVTFPTLEGELAASSSHGPTRDGRIKPDVTSTGEVTLSCLQLSAQAWFLANQPFKLAQGGMHIRDGGTSSAAPAVSGIIALYLQKNPTATWQDIRNRVTLCTMTDIYTGTNLPDNEWGNGKVDAMAVMTGCNALGVNESTSNHKFSIYPNPVSNELTIVTQDLQSTELSVKNILGQEVMRAKLHAFETVIPVNQLAPGIYFLSLNADTRSVLRFVKQ